MLPTLPFLSPPHLPLMVSQVLFGQLIHQGLLIPHWNQPQQVSSFFIWAHCVHEDWQSCSFSMNSMELMFTGALWKWCSSKESPWSLWASSRDSQYKSKKWHLLGHAPLKETWTHLRFPLAPKNYSRSEVPGLVLYKCLNCFAVTFHLNFCLSAKFLSYGKCCHFRFCFHSQSELKECV